MGESGEWTETFDAEVEKTATVKSVKVTENSESADVYASGEVYDTDNISGATNIEVEVVAFDPDTLAKMRGDKVGTNGSIIKGGNGARPFFAYGKVVKLKGGKVRYEWYPKCKDVYKRQVLSGFPITIPFGFQKIKRYIIAKNVL